MQRPAVDEVAANGPGVLRNARFGPREPTTGLLAY